MEITFRKHVARKGAGDEADIRLVPSASSGLSLLLVELEAVPPHDDPLAELTAILGREPLTLAAVLDARDTLQTHADRVFGLAGRIAKVVNRCLDLPPCPTQGVPPGF